ncbi:hypothetical protein POKO110462_12325 [Pontibacter korlensis]|uniref:Uncharacterized protein n=1 Tax=Pontibacter korlensis TaxID=400092 RepID=A0A0E3UW95_9BACT|nr:hypothetical protein [Pontibacter korlensis]AKD02501.1 hypothetical protein PKOR_04410 [Pontibacter korlensis]
MKRILYVLTLISLTGFASCSAPAEENSDNNVEELEDRAEENTDNMEDTAEEADTSAVIE